MGKMPGEHVFNLRWEITRLLQAEDFVTDKTGVRTIELVGASFIADQDFIFGELNRDYLNREIEWYTSQSCNVNDFPGGAPTIWKQIADRDGFVNSNYGWMIWSGANYSQYDNAIAELRKNPLSRRAVMIYNSPDMWYRYNRNGRSDFACTNAVQLLYRKGKLNMVVQMRSNDVVFGYRNDRHWQQHVLDLAAEELGYEPGTITWQVGSLHVYERHFYLVHHFLQVGEPHITKNDFRKLYPDSTYPL